MVGNGDETASGDSVRAPILAEPECLLIRSNAAKQTGMEGELLRTRVELEMASLDRGGNQVAHQILIGKSKGFAVSVGDGLKETRGSEQLPAPFPVFRRQCLKLLA